MILFLSVERELFYKNLFCIYLTQWFKKYTNYVVGLQWN